MQAELAFAAPRPTDVSPRRFWMTVGLATLALILGCWLSSGTLAPYGTVVSQPCQYRTSVDDPQFRSVFLMLDGYPAEQWNGSVVLRRILHPVLAYPLIKAFDFALGGFLFNIIALVLAQLGLALAIRRYFAARAAVLVTWLFASYPGYAYWVGLPYSYGLIVPGCVACLVALLWVNERPSLARCGFAACVVGIVGLGYDLMPFFGGALLLTLLLARRWLGVVVAAVVLGAWALFISRGLPAIFDFPPVNSNTQVYSTVVEAYLDAWNRVDGWGELLIDLPGTFVHNFFFSNFVFLPVLFLGLVGIRSYWRLRPVIHPVALSILLSTLAVFLFLNLAPPYVGSWVLRGDWIARVYQPWFVAVLVLVAASSVGLRHARHYKLISWFVIVVASLNAAVIAGPFIGLTPLYGSLNYRFYQAQGHNQNAAWLRKLGRRPYGFCR